MSGGLQGPAPEERPRPEGRRNSQGIRIDPEVEAEPGTRRTVLSTLVDHEPGVLAAVSGLFRRRQFNIESLTVGPTEDEDYARMTIVIEEPEPGIEQAKKLGLVDEVVSPALLQRAQLALVEAAGDLLAVAGHEGDRAALVEQLQGALDLRERDSELFGEDLRDGLHETVRARCAADRMAPYARAATCDPCGGRPAARNR